ncbi:MAG: gliding motility-associated C-terminal domain-containing protein [Mangrovibacterium sp.]
MQFVLVTILALASFGANAQTVVKQNSSTILSVNKEEGVSYSWDLFTGDTKEFANNSGNLSSKKAFFLNSFKDGATVTVQWLEAGTYFFRVVATSANGCTDNIKVGQIIVGINSVNPPIANDDAFQFECMPIQGNLLANDVTDPDAIRTNVSLVTPTWDVQGNFKITQQGMLEYTCSNSLPNTVDSIQYILQSIYKDRAPIERKAMVRVSIGNVDCNAPAVPEAINDTYAVICGENMLDVTKNDIYNDNFEVQIEIIEWPTKGTLQYVSDTEVSYIPDSGAHGTDYFKYEIYYKEYSERYDRAEVTLNIPDNLDCTAGADTTYTLFIPEAFTPNGDGVHDTWVVDGVELNPNATMTVYTRAGQKVFEKQAYGSIEKWGESNRWWNGTDASGNQVVAGVYLYTYNTGSKLIRGFVMVAYGEGQIGN